MAFDPGEVIAGFEDDFDDEHPAFFGLDGLLTQVFRVSARTIGVQSVRLNSKTMYSFTKLYRSRTLMSQ